MLKTLRPKSLAQFTVAVAMLGSAFGLTAVAAAIAEVAWFRPFAYPNPENVFAIHLVGPSTPVGLVTLPSTLFEPWQTAPLERTSLGSYQRSLQRMNLPTGSKDHWVIETTQAVSEVVGLQVWLGRPLTESDQSTDVALLSFDAWQTHFAGRPDIIGVQLEVGSSKRTIVGVQHPSFVLPGVPRAVLYVPLSRFPINERDSEVSQRNAIVRTSLPPDSMASRLQERANSQLKSYGGPRNLRLRIVAVPIAETVRPPLAAGLLSLTMVVALIALAAISVIHLEAAAIAELGQELSIRLALGAPARSIPQAVMGRIVPPMTVAFAVATVLAGTTLQRVGFDLQAALALLRPPSLTATPFWLAFAVAAVLGVAMVAGVSITLSRALLSGRYSLLGTSSQRITSRPQMLLLSTQICCSAVLLTLASTATGLFLLVAKDDIGVDTDNVFTALVVSDDLAPALASARYSQMRTTLEHHPEIDSVGFTDILLFGGVFPIRQSVRTPIESIENVKVRRVDAGFFNVFRLRATSGRVLQPDDEVGQVEVAVINQRFALSLLRGEPIGQVLGVAETGPLRIVGVVPDVRDERLTKAAEPTVYVPISDATFARTSTRALVLRLRDDTPRGRTATAEAVAPFMRKERPGRLTRLTDRMESVLVAPATYVAISAAFALVALVMAVGGTYSVATSIVARRRAEVAIRSAFGASPTSIVVWLARSVVLPISVGLIAGGAMGVALSNTVSSMAFSESPVPLWWWLGGVVVLGAAALLSIAVPARAAASRNPIEVLRSLK